ncbi:PREDICTED: uncharacterized protein LOC107188350 [Dufourea novaeangliae]|uniref:uncharacterized protein LOC107188350 n=1 Tax=Dufourea novaeangliae TaxID=178035 RepID=UPI000766F6FA|nr:PREDICTED: uncharacterized protein LOC107188350 [Dufourea novaeangliae]
MAILKIFHFMGREVKDYSSVCSKHFEPKDFVYKIVGNDVRRFLAPTAVPCILHPQSNSVQSENMTLIGSVCRNSVLTEINIPLVSELDANLSNDSEGSVVDEEEDKDSTKRKKEDEPPPSTSVKRRCNARYIGDLRREDFTSDLSWNIVQNFVIKSRKKQKSLNYTVEQLSLKVESLKLLLDHFKKKALKSVEPNADKGNESSKELQLLIDIELDHNYFACNG